MRRPFCLLILAFFALAQSPHVFRRDNRGALDVQVHQLSLGGTEIVGRNGSFEDNRLLTAMDKREGTEPTEKEQEGRRPPMFPRPACFWCPRKTVLQGNPWDLLAAFSTEEFIRRTRAVDQDLRDTCVFYTRIERKPPEGLSQLATQLACKYGKYSIWHLWPNAANEGYNDRLLNYYGLAKENSRIHPIWNLDVVEGSTTGKRGRIVYFENMSRAMASMCTGQIYVLTQTPEDLQRYSKPPVANIWGSTELPTLIRRLNYLENSLIVINASGVDPKPLAWKVNWRTLLLQGQANFRRDGGNPMEGWIPYDLDSEERTVVGPQKKNKRNLCLDSGVDDEPSGEDFFG